MVSLFYGNDSDLLHIKTHKYKSINKYYSCRNNLGLVYVALTDCVADYNTLCADGSTTIGVCQPYADVFENLVNGEHTC